jgi:hypothetical protein
MALIFSLLLADVSGAASRYRKLERALGESSFTDAEMASISRAYGAVLGAGGERGEALDLVEACLEGEFQAKQVMRILSLTAQLELAGLPSEGFVHKVKEGVAKGIEGEMILEVAEKKALFLRRANNLLNRIILDGYDIEDRELLLTAVAEALEEGRKEKKIRTRIIRGLEKGESARRIGRAIYR